MIKYCNLSLAEALYMASVNPVHALGLEKQMGCIRPGFSASMTMLDHNINAVGIIVEGKVFTRQKPNQNDH